MRCSCALLLLLAFAVTAASSLDAEITAPALPQNAEADQQSDRRLTECAEAIAAQEAAANIPGHTARSFFLVFISAVQLVALFAAHHQGLTGWEPLWVIGVEGCNYFMQAVRPGTGDLVLVTGVNIPWLRYVGWLITCPVLLMFLVSMTYAA